MAAPRSTGNFLEFLSRNVPPSSLTSFGVGYFTIDTASATSTGIYDVEFLNNRPAVLETEFVRVIKFDNPLEIGINGLKGTGVVVKPDK